MSSDPIVHITGGVPDSGTGNITTLGMVLDALPTSLGAAGGLKVDGSGTPLPVSISSLPSTPAGSNVIGHVIVDSVPTTAVTAASLPLPTGAATAALQPTNATQGSTTAGQTGHLVQGAVTTSAPTYTTAQTSPLSLDTFGNLRVASTAEGATSDTAYAGAGNASIIAALKGLYASVNGAIPAGTSIIGKVGIDQTTDGTTNAVHLTAGTNIAGKFGIDQTTPGTTNKVSIGTDGTVAINTALPAGTNTIGATTGPTTTASRVNAAASTNATNLKASAGNLYAIRVFNVAAYNVFLKIYNKASSPTVGTDTPVWTIPIQAGGGFSSNFDSTPFPLGTGISYAITKLQADTDTTAVVAGDVTGTIQWA